MLGGVHHSVHNGYVDSFGWGSSSTEVVRVRISESHCRTRISNRLHPRDSVISEKAEPLSSPPNDVPPRGTICRFDCVEST
jgi:hypothetical protein